MGGYRGQGLSEVPWPFHRFRFALGFSLCGRLSPALAQDVLGTRAPWSKMLKNRKEKIIAHNASMEL